MTLSSLSRVRDCSAGGNARRNRNSFFSIDSQESRAQLTCHLPNSLRERKTGVMGFFKKLREWDLDADAFHPWYRAARAIAYNLFALSLACLFLVMLTSLNDKLDDFGRHHPLPALGLSVCVAFTFYRLFVWLVSLCAKPK